MAWFGPKWVRASRKAGREYFKKIFPFLLVVYETLLVYQVSEKLIFWREDKRTALMYCMHWRTKTSWTYFNSSLSELTVTGSSRTENWHRRRMRKLNFVPIRSDPMLIFLSGNRPSGRLPLKKAEWISFTVVPIVVFLEYWFNTFPQVEELSW